MFFGTERVLCRSLLYLPLIVSDERKKHVPTASTLVTGIFINKLCASFFYCTCCCHLADCERRWPSGGPASYGPPFDQRLVQQPRPQTDDASSDALSARFTKYFVFAYFPRAHQPTLHVNDFKSCILEFLKEYRLVRCSLMPNSRMRRWVYKYITQCTLAS